MRCRSRGELGSCGDPFPFNITEPDAEAGIHVVACPSGWCAKLSEGNPRALKADGENIIALKNSVCRFTNALPD